MERGFRWHLGGVEPCPRRGALDAVPEPLLGKERASPAPHRVGLGSRNWSQNQGSEPGQLRTGLALTPVQPQEPVPAGTALPGTGWPGRGRSQVAGQARKKTRLFCRTGLFPRPVRSPLGPWRPGDGSEFVLLLELSQLWSFSPRARCSTALTTWLFPALPKDGVCEEDASTAWPGSGSGSPSQAGGNRAGQTHWSMTEAAAASWARLTLSARRAH